MKRTTPKWVAVVHYPFMNYGYYFPEKIKNKSHKSCYEIFSLTLQLMKPTCILCQASAVFFFFSKIFVGFRLNANLSLFMLSFNPLMNLVIMTYYFLVFTIIPPKFHILEATKLFSFTFGLLLHTERVVFIKNLIL